MKKKILGILMAAMMLSLTACGGQKPDAVPDSAGETAETETETENTGETESEPVKEIDSDWTEALDEAQPVQTGEEVTEDGLIKFSFGKSYWADDLEPSSPDGNYSYVEAPDGYCFLICEGTVQNLSSEEIDLSSSMGPLWGSVATVFIFDDTDAYYGNWYTGKGSISYSLAANAEDTLYVAVSVPEAMKETAGKVQVLTGFSDLKETAGITMGEDTGVNWPALPHKYLADVELPRN